MLISNYKFQIISNYKFQKDSKVVTTNSTFANQNVNEPDTINADEKEMAKGGGRRHKI